MTKQYHHGNLKEELIFKGLVLLNEKGVDGFSIRKVATLCGVSHNAPYKHFKNKDEFIKAISDAVWVKFHEALDEAANTNDGDMGKEYVKFMIRNPEYLKFMFLSNNPRPVRIVDDKLPDDNDGPFGVFKMYAEKYFQDIGLSKDQYLKKTLQMWSMVHGLSTLIVKGSIIYEGDIEEFIDALFK